MTERVLSRVWSIGILPDALHSDLFNASSAARCVARFECLGWFRKGDDEPEADIDTHPDEAAIIAPRPRALRLFGVRPILGGLRLHVAHKPPRHGARDDAPTKPAPGTARARSTSRSRRLGTSGS
jgi:hypothetical protein